MEETFTLAKIYQAYLDCRKRKRNTINALKFEQNRERNLIALLKELKNRNYKISRHICFVVKKPKPREIFAADFRDRVVHHLLFNEIGQIFEKDFIEESYANRKGKGTHKGVEKLREHIKAVGKSSYYLKLDIKSFFCSMNKDILFKIVSEKIKASGKPDYWKNDILWLSQKIIFNDPTQNYVFRGRFSDRELITKDKSLFYSNGKGLPIGNLTSQFFANVYLSGLDDFISRNLGYRYYLRYVDDFIILEKNKKKLLLLEKTINGFLKRELDLEIKKDKTIFQPIARGIDFLGYFVKPSHILVKRTVVGNLKTKLYFYNKNEVFKKIGKKTANKILATINSYFGHFSHAFTFKLRKHICEGILRDAKEIFSPATNFAFVKIKFGALFKKYQYER